jgi:hypothetical protein
MGIKERLKTPTPIQYRAVGLALVAMFTTMSGQELYSGKPVYAGILFLVGFVGYFLANLAVPKK